ncbi:MAG: putative colanic acid biosysnthesis UDP-glucose lipid carrier transferase [Parcubacteria bacterium C7867-008]|nr:MAG: putative colanic acid biosysnthesis UDP-glucose lipid carrier transferase [Parcubacteria bacterium C7867-008]
MTYGRKAILILFLGDVVAFVSSLWLTLLFRYGQVPTDELITDHLPSFGLLFALWILVFYMAGLYGKRIVLFKSRLWGIILRVQSFNIVLAALFFFFIPGIAIAPKTNLILYLFISLAIVFFWRIGAFPRISRPSNRTHAAIIGTGPEVWELVEEVNNNPRYHLDFPVVEEPETLIQDFDLFASKLQEAGVSMLVVDTANDVLRPLLPRIYELSFITQRYQFADFYDVYEEVFDRVPLSLLEYDWFLKNVSATGASFYGASKRVIDILGALAMGLITLIALPFVFIALKLEGPGPLFLKQDRIGRHGEKVRAYKFRSMTSDNTASAEWVGEEQKTNRVTKVGAVLRQTSLDEFPQFLNILRGEISLIGPRNDIEGLGSRLAEAIPYYNIRYIVTPGITGWAQINQQYEQGNISPQSIEETKTRLAYDFYYIKNRSLALDIVIALKTVKRMLFRISSW